MKKTEHFHDVWRTISIVIIVFAILYFGGRLLIRILGGM